MRATLLLACLLPLAACDVPYPREEAGQYRQGVIERGYTVAFDPGTAEPAEDDRAALVELRSVVRRDTTITLSGTGPLIGARAARVAELLGRPVAAEAVARSLFSGPGRDEGELLLTQPGLVADACSGPPLKVGRTLWVIGDYSRQELLPPGCAVATALLEQTVDKRDLLRGRFLEPGAAGPMARAAERYLRRNDAVRQVRNEERGGPGGPPSAEDRDREQAGAGPGGSPPPGPSTNQPPAPAAAPPAPAAAAPAR